jgi:hypothetical protein
MERPKYPDTICRPAGTGPIIEHDDPAAPGSRYLPWMMSLFVHAAVGLLLTVLVLFQVFHVAPVAERVPAMSLEQAAYGQVIQREYAEDDHLDDFTLSERYSQTDNPARADATNDTVASVTARGMTPPGGGARHIGPFTEGGRPTGLFQPDAEADVAGCVGNVLFVIDRSGSMHGTFDEVRQELNRCISAMGSEQRFGLILFSDNDPLTFAGGSLVPANAENLAAAVEFLASVKPAGQTDPLPALDRAFAAFRGTDGREGRLIQLLTDGSFPDNRAALELIDRESRRRPVMINTVLYGHYAPNANAVLAEIANRTGGVYRYLSPDEVGG